MESDDDGSLDGVDWKEEEVTEQDRLDAEEELPPELRYNGEGENNCSDERVVNENQEAIPALKRVDEMAVIPDLKQLVEEKAVIPDPTLRVYESLSVITSPSRTVNERMSVITSPSQKSHSAARSTAPAKPTDSSRIAHPPGGLAYDENRESKSFVPARKRLRTSPTHRDYANDEKGDPVFRDPSWKQTRTAHPQAAATPVTPKADSLPRH